MSNDRLLEKKDIIFLRDKDGNFIPEKVPIDFRDENIKQSWEVNDIILKEMIKKRDIVGEDSLKQQSKIVDYLKEQYESSGENKEIYIIPVTNSEIKYYNMTLKDDETGEYYRLDAEGNRVEDQDADIISRHCYNPKFTYDEAKEIPAQKRDAFLFSILKGSGHFGGNHIANAQKQIEEMNKEFEEQKKAVADDKAEKSFISFMHDQGYNYFNMGGLTKGEINRLIEAWNDKCKKK